MSDDADSVLEALIAAALECEADGREVRLEQVCAERPDLLPAVAAALSRSGALGDLHRVASAQVTPRERVLAGRYRLDAPLGAGAMGVVHSGFDLELQRRVAVKILRTELLDGRVAAARFDREAEVLAAVRHGAVVTVFDRGKTAEGLRFLVMELLDGLPLSDLLAAASERAETVGLRELDDTAWLRRFFDADAAIESSFLRQVIRWAAELADGLEAVHSTGVLHRDIKPSNVFLRRDASAVLVDFGIAARDAEATIASRETPIGTPAYLDPRQLEPGASAAANASVDVYGLTSTLYHMVTLRPPYEGTPHEVFAAIQRREPPLASGLRPGLPRDVQAVLDRGMHRNPARRYGSASALGEDLEALLAFRPVTARSTGRLARAVRRVVRSRDFYVGLAILAVLGAVGAVFGWQRSALEARREQWADVWRELPPALFDAPVRLRRIEDAAARAAVAARLDRLVEFRVEPVPSLLLRAAFSLDNGDARAAAADMNALAKEIDTPYTHAVAASYDRVPTDAVDAEGLELPPLPAMSSALEAYVFVFHRLRTPDQVTAAEIALLDGGEEAPLFLRDLQLRCRFIVTMAMPEREMVGACRDLLEQAIRLEVAHGRRTALTATVVGVLYLLEGRASEAVDVLRQGVELAPESHSLRINYANTLRTIGDMQGAREQLEVAIRMRPETLGARRTLLHVLLDLKDFDAAERLFGETPFATGDEGRGQRHWMRGTIALARAVFHEFRDEDVDRLRHARRAVEELAAGEGLGNAWCADGLPMARALAEEYDDVVLEYLRRAIRNPIDWRNLTDLAATMPEQLTPEQTRSMREFVLALRRTLAPLQSEPR
ncbi:MAG: protein kinase [Planctomycetes bacterium]|nr:protein kinase [Planctomycetota bacterium]